MSKNPRLNNSGCNDPTAYAALKPIIKEDAVTEKLAHTLVKTIKNIVDWAGFEVIGRIKVVHKESGREFK